MIPANPDMILSFSVSFFRREAALEQVNKSCDREHTRSVSEKDGNGTLFLVDMEINEVVPEDNKYIYITSLAIARCLCQQTFQVIVNEKIPNSSLIYLLQRTLYVGYVLYIVLSTIIVATSL